MARSEETNQVFLGAKVVKIVLNGVKEDKKLLSFSMKLQTLNNKL